MPQNEHGAFLIRDSESRRNDFSLSVRDGDTVKHYRIRQLDEGGFFIARRTTFRTLQELVDHYSRDADGLCVNLRKPCVQVNISGFQMWWKNTFCLFLVLQLIKGVLFEVMFIHVIRNKIGNWNSIKACYESVTHVLKIPGTLETQSRKIGPNKAAFSKKVS